jgi:hypothetical protein
LLQLFLPLFFGKLNNNLMLPSSLSNSNVIVTSIIVVVAKVMAGASVGSQGGNSGASYASSGRGVRTFTVIVMIL